MAMKSLFPKEIMQSSGGELSPDVVATKLSYFEIQFHNLHWATKSFAEHEALGKIYDKVFDMKDEIVEKIMGYTGTRAKTTGVSGLKDYTVGVSEQVVNELISFAKQLENYAASNNMPAIENIAQSLSGEAAQTKYRLTLS